MYQMMNKIHVNLYFLNLLTNCPNAGIPTTPPISFKLLVGLLTTV